MCSRQWLGQREEAATPPERRLPATLLRGRAWAVYDSLDKESTDTYAHLKPERPSSMPVP